MMEYIETVIVGGGQAGLATSYHLTQNGREHLIMEQAPQAAHVWRDERWDSFTLVTPNWSLKLPGAKYNGPEPNGFMPRAEIIAYFEKYVERFQLPVVCNTRVLSIEPLERKGYRVQTSGKTFTAKNVVIATGFFQKPKIPSFASGISPDITQLHSSAYRNPESLPPGSVLIVGSAQSGCQIAEELYQHGRKVFLCTGSAGRAPRRYRGRDVIEWLDIAGVIDLTPEQLPPGMGKFKGIPHFSGTKGGHTLNLHQFARDGVTLLGHLRDAKDDKIFLASDLHENLQAADGFEAGAVQMIDGYIQAHGLDAPLEELPQLRDGYEQAVITELDLKAYDIKTVIWAIGYTFDYRLVHLPVRDGAGFPIQTNGISRYPGLYFVGMPWMPTERPGFLLGVGERAGDIAFHISERAAR
jgi:putative flavoprotein involved in K+ transport